MARLWLASLIFFGLVLAACGGESSVGSCTYTLHDDVTGEVETMTSFPPVVRARSDIPPLKEPPEGFSVVLEHPSDYAYLKTLVVPACREPEARQILAQRH